MENETKPKRGRPPLPPELRKAPRQLRGALSIWKVDLPRFNAVATLVGGGHVEAVHAILNYLDARREDFNAFLKAEF